MREQEAIGIMTDLSPVDYTDLTEPLRRSVMQLHHFSSDGCVVTSAHSAIAAVFPGGSAERVARHIPRRRTTAVHGEALFQEAEDLGFSFAEVSRSCPPDFLDRPDLKGLPVITASSRPYFF